MMNPMSSELMMTDGRAEAYINFLSIFQLLSYLKFPLKEIP